jgi:hypothetical protein
MMISSLLNNWFRVVPKVHRLLQISPNTATEETLRLPKCCDLLGWEASHRQGIFACNQTGEIANLQ